MIHRVYLYVQYMQKHIYTANYINTYLCGLNYLENIVCSPDCVQDKLHIKYNEVTVTTLHTA